MNYKQGIAAALTVSLVTVFTLVAAGQLSWIAFWVLSALLLVYITYAAPNAT